MARIKKIGIRYLAKVHGIIGGIVGLLLGILYSFGGFAIDALVTMGVITSNETPGLSYGTILAFGALLGMPLIFSVAGYIAGAIGAVLFNLVVPLLGGVELDFKR